MYVYPFAFLLKDQRVRHVLDQLANRNGRVSTCSVALIIKLSRLKKRLTQNLGVDPLSQSLHCLRIFYLSILQSGSQNRSNTFATD